jgi:predicted ester cyclase
LLPTLSITRILSCGRGQKTSNTWVSGVQTAFSETSRVIEDLIGEGDRVAFRFTLTGVHSGTFAGIPPTGKRFTLTGMDFIRIANGELGDLWSAQDTLSLLRQFGADV